MSDEKTSQRDFKASSASETTVLPDPQLVSDVVPVDSDPASDVQVADSKTIDAPSFRSPAPSPGPARKPPTHSGSRPLALSPGAKIDDFQIVRLLGRGAFGHVYLARQLSLDRDVALKISANLGSEGRTMARLEHAHIVQVFSENVDAATNQRLLCMQLVPGVGLEKIISALTAQAESKRMVAGDPAADADSQLWNGSDLLAVIDLNATLPAALDPAALRDREALAHMDSIEATAWIGARLAEALDFAHRHGVLHRDIKPANILVSPYGRPMLADFNISAQQAGAGEGEEGLFGGTIAYMAPEHLDAFNSAETTQKDEVNEQADIYSLGIVLQELLEGQHKSPPRDPNVGMVEMLRRIAAERRKTPPICRAGPPSARKTLEQTIGHCLAPSPSNRFASGADLAEQLEGCRAMRHAERKLPPSKGLLARIMRRPFTWFVVLVVLPQLIGTAINIPYNKSQIGAQLTTEQKQIFMQLVKLYNFIAYPIAVALFVWVVLRVRRVWRALHGPLPLAADVVATARRQALQLPLWVAGLTIAGWIPGGLLFPAIISARTQPLDAHTWMHFIASFSLSGLIALAYSLCGSQFVVQRALYPRMWDDVRHYTEIVRSELSPIPTRLGWIQLLAGSIPLLAAGLFVVLGNLEQQEQQKVFRCMVGGLIFLGMFGFELSKSVARNLTDTYIALTGAKG